MDEKFDLKSYLARERELVETHLLSIINGMEIEAPVLREAMAYSLLAGGKRLRPILLLAAHEVFSPVSTYAYDAACAIEFLHTYSLIHDDLPAFDDDDLRRGQPACHVKYSEWLAILAGDALNTMAFGLLAGGPDDVPEKWKLEAVTIASTAAGAQGMAGGQALDMEFEERPVGEDEVRRMQRLKTGAMIAASVEIGAMLAGADDESRARLRSYGEKLGQAFQIRDDILDISGRAEELGKSTGKDGESGKATLPVVIGEGKAMREAERLSDEACALLDLFDERAEPLRAIARFAVARRR